MRIKGILVKYCFNSVVFSNIGTQTLDSSFSGLLPGSLSFQWWWHSKVRSNICVLRGILKLKMGESWIQQWKIHIVFYILTLGIFLEKCTVPIFTNKVVIWKVIQFLKNPPPGFFYFLFYLSVSSLFCVSLCISLKKFPKNEFLCRLNLVQEETSVQMSVLRAPSAVHDFLSGAFLGNRMTYLDDIWYVGGARAEVAHAEFWACTC